MQGKNQSILLGALVAALLGIILVYVAQLNQYVGIVACCVPGVLGALVAVWHYTDNASLTMSSGEGAKLGAIAAAVGSLISTVLSFLLQSVGVMRTPEEQMEFQRRAMESQGLSPEQIDQALGFTETLTSPIAMVGFALLGVLLSALLGAVGGAIGANVFKKGGSPVAVEDDE